LADLDDVKVAVGQRREQHRNNGPVANRLSLENRRALWSRVHAIYTYFDTHGATSVWKNPAQALMMDGCVQQMVVTVTICDRRVFSEHHVYR
jgi:hypothetical protein